MKKILILMMVTAFMLTSCFSGRDDEHNNTLGDDNGDGVIEDTTDDGVSGGNAVGEIKDGVETLIDDVRDEVDGMIHRDDVHDSHGEHNDNIGESTLPKPVRAIVDKVDSSDDAVNFITENVYSDCKNVIPLMTVTRTLTEDEARALMSGIGLIADETANEVILSASSIESFSYSLMMFRGSKATADALHNELREKINPSSPLGIIAERAALVRLDNDIVFVMGSREQVDTVTKAIREKALGVYVNVGQAEYIPD